MEKVTKVVVVTGRDARAFTGEDIKVSNKTDGSLVIQDGEKVLGVFKIWRFWRVVKGDTKIGEAMTSVKRILIRPDRPMVATRWNAFLKNLHGNQVVPIPKGYDIIVVYKSGEIKVL